MFFHVLSCSFMFLTCSFLFLTCSFMFFHVLNMFFPVLNMFFHVLNVLVCFKLNRLAVVGLETQTCTAEPQTCTNQSSVNLLTGRSRRAGRTLACYQPTPLRGGKTRTPPPADKTLPCRPHTLSPPRGGRRIRASTATAKVQGAGRRSSRMEGGATAQRGRERMGISRETRGRWRVGGTRRPVTSLSTSLRGM